MGVREHLPIFTDGGDRGTHYECEPPRGQAPRHSACSACRDCGTNLTRDHESCPDCGGGVASYDL